MQQEAQALSGVDKVSQSVLLAHPKVQQDIANLLAAGSVKSILLRECAWCRTYLGVKEGNGATGVTSGVCLPCGIKNLPAHLHDAFRQQYNLEMVQIGSRWEVI